MFVKKTITLLNGDNPTQVICAGHIDAKTFNKAFKAEGWDSQGDYKQKELKFVYMVSKELKKGTKYTEVMPYVKGAKKYTMAAWD